MNMEIEESPTTMAQDKVAVHPLALVHMSDHYTRVRRGGSTAPTTDAPVVGLLFGQNSNESSTVVVTDAEDTPLDNPGPAVTLHQAVFANNVVVGSYRVTNNLDEEPTATDLQQTLALRKSFDTAAYFGLLQVRQPPTASSSGKSTNETTDPKSNASSNKELPLQLFMLPPNNTNVLVALADWQLKTAAPERVAIERVLRDKPGPQTTQIREAWQALDARLAQLVHYLEQTQGSCGTTTAFSQHYELWRQIQGLLVQAHLLRTSSTTTAMSSSAAALQQVAVLAKTVDAVAWYTDKYRAVQETITAHSSRGGSKGSSSGLSASSFLDSSSNRRFGE